MARRGLRERLLYFAIVPSIVLSVLVLGYIALRTTLQIEKARQQTVFDATLTLADERVDRLDKLIIAQDNVVAAHVDLSSLTNIARKWLPTAARETPTVRAILVLDMTHADHDVLAFASRAPGREDDTFRRLLHGRLFPHLNFSGDTDELRHLHQVIDQQSILISYWQRSYFSRRYLIVAWHDVPRLVHDIFPRLYGDIDRGNSRMNVIDEDGRIVFGPPIKGGEFTVGRPFPTTLYNWRLQIALTTADDLEDKVERQRLLELGMVAFAGVVVLVGMTIIVLASIKERHLAALKSDFVANVSHELKTPLALVRMFGEILLADRVPSDEKRRQYLQIIVSESERLTALIENVLDFAKVERGKAAYEFAPDAWTRSWHARSKCIDIVRSAMALRCISRRLKSYRWRCSMRALLNWRLSTCSTTPSNTRKTEAAWTWRSSDKASLSWSAYVIKDRALNRTSKNAFSSGLSGVVMLGKIEYAEVELVWRWSNTLRKVTGGRFR